MTFADIRAARRMIAGVADAAPFVPSPYMSLKAGHEFLLKLECMPPIGAFKLRGALNAMAALPAKAKRRVNCARRSPRAVGKKGLLQNWSK